MPQLYLIVISPVSQRSHQHRYLISVSSVAFVSVSHRYDIVIICISAASHRCVCGAVWGLLGLPGARLGPPGAPGASWGLLGVSGAS